MKIGQFCQILWLWSCRLLQPSWKMATILNFQVTNVIFPISDPRDICMPILVLVSQFERLFHLFADGHFEKWLPWAPCWKFMMAPYPNLLRMPLAISVPNFMLLSQNAQSFCLTAPLYSSDAKYFNNSRNVNFIMLAQEGEEKVSRVEGWGREGVQGWGLGEEKVPRVEGWW